MATEILKAKLLWLPHEILVRIAIRCENRRTLQKRTRVCNFDRKNCFYDPRIVTVACSFQRRMFSHISFSLRAICFDTYVCFTTRGKREKGERHLLIYLFILSLYGQGSLKCIREREKTSKQLEINSKWSSSGCFLVNEATGILFCSHTCSY